MHHTHIFAEYAERDLVLRRICGRTECIDTVGFCSIRKIEYISEFETKIEKYLRRFFRSPDGFVWKTGLDQKI
jgi:hypothetical protein